MRLLDPLIDRLLLKAEARRRDTYSHPDVLAEAREVADNELRQRLRRQEVDARISASKQVIADRLDTTVD